MVKFSDLSGELITDDDAVARIVIQEHPELAGAAVEIEVLADEARAVEKAALRVALVDLYLPGEDEARHVAVDLAAFDKLATDKPVSELLITARPARKAVKPREKRGGTEAPPAASRPASTGSTGSTGGGGGGVGGGGGGKSRAAAAAAPAVKPAAPAPAVKPAAPPASAASLAAAGLTEAVA
jgi:uncharacterized membrane protein YgcG